MVKNTWEMMITEKFCVFLRGVNAGGAGAHAARMKMDALKKAFAAMSFQDARTVLATGNVIIALETGDRAAQKPRIESSLSAFFHYDASVFLRSAEELRAVLSAAKTLDVPEGCHLYYLICDSRETLLDLSRLFVSLPHKDKEAYIPLESGAFWIVPVGATLESAFGSKALGDKKYKALLTTRTIGTVKKIVVAMSAP